MHDITRKTTLKVTKATMLMENLLVKRMKISRTEFHRQAVDHFLEGDQLIYEELLIRNWRDPRYVHKDALEQVYLDLGREAALRVVADRCGCGITIVIFQALLEYCDYLAPQLLKPEELKKLFG